jgi:hypothetical protein
MTEKKFIFAFLIIMAAVSLWGCGIAVPADKAEYVGEWRSAEMYLLITRDGSVRYQRIKGGVTKSVSGPIRAFEGNNLIVGVPMITTTFVVSEPPRLSNNQWKMTVDGVVLVKTGS